MVVCRTGYGAEKSMKTDMQIVYRVALCDKLPIELISYDSGPSFYVVLAPPEKRKYRYARLVMERRR